VALSALDTKSQVLRAKDFGANLGWHGNTTMSTSATLKDAYALGLGADFIINPGDLMRTFQGWPALRQKVQSD